MIIVEEILDEVFSQIPEIQGFTTKFDWGNEKHLNSLMKLYDGAGKSIYPLIYKTSKNSEQTVNNEAVYKLSLVLACRNTEISLTNRQRWATSYRNILYPLAQYIEDCFVGAGIFIWDGKYSLDEYPNYGNSKDENITTDIWDALLFETSIKVKKGCINKINF